MFGAGIPEYIQAVLHPKARRVVQQGEPRRLSTPLWATYSLSPLCSGSDPALGLCVGKPQPFLTFSLLPKQLQPQLLSNSWMLDLKTCGMWGPHSVGWTRGAGGKAALSRGAGGHRGGVGCEAEGRAGRKPHSAAGGWRGEFGRQRQI